MRLPPNRGHGVCGDGDLIHRAFAGDRAVLAERRTPNADDRLHRLSNLWAVGQSPTIGRRNKMDRVVKVTELANPRRLRWTS